MLEREPTIEDLAAMSRALGLGFTGVRLEAVLPEVRRLWAQAEELRALPLDELPPEAPGGAVPGA
jgi:hypothetical protein